MTDVDMIDVPGMFLNKQKDREWTEGLVGLAKNNGCYRLFPGASLFMNENWRYSTGGWNILDIRPEGSSAPSRRKTS